MSTAAEVIDLCRTAGLTLACAESLTGGLLSAELTSVPGASSVVRGGMVTYATGAKAAVLGVDGRVLDRVGPVSPQVAAQMAQLVAERFGTDIGVATTGVAGPEPVGEHPVGEVFIAVHDLETGTVVYRYEFTGSRGEIRSATVAAAVDAIASLLRAGVSESSQ